MQEKPNIADQELINAIERGYELSISSLTFLPIGADPRASVYEVSTEDNQRYFLKVRLGALHPPAYLVPHLLYQNGIEQVIAPLAVASNGVSPGGVSSDGMNSDEDVAALWQTLPGRSYSLILYPFVDGQTGFSAQLTTNEWHRLGQILARIHGTALPEEQLGGIRREDFSLHPKLPPMLTQINELVAQVEAGNRQLSDLQHQALFAFWQEKREEINGIIARTIELGRQSRQRAKPLVPCHADFHTFNVLVESELDGPERALTIVDWDETLLAPVERDLMFVIGQSAGLIKVDDQNQAAFLEGYVSEGGCAAEQIDPAITAFYRYEWVVQEIGEYGSLVFFDEEFGEETRADALNEFKELFSPGNVVEGAYRSDIAR